MQQTYLHVSGSSVSIVKVCQRIPPPVQAQSPARQNPTGIGVQYPFVQQLSQISPAQ